MGRGRGGDPAPDAYSPLFACDDCTFVNQFIRTQTADLSALFSQYCRARHPKGAYSCGHDSRRYRRSDPAAPACRVGQIPHLVCKIRGWPGQKKSEPQDTASRLGRIAGRTFADIRKRLREPFLREPTNPSQTAQFRRDPGGGTCTTPARSSGLSILSPVLRMVA
jgi:hypothetical protein